MVTKGVGTTQWRAWDQPRTRSGLVVGLLVLALLGYGASRVSGPVRAALLGLVVAGAITAARALLSRVRLTDAGVEVRTLSTRTYAWAEIAGAELAADRPGVLLRLRGGPPSPDPVRLPLPTGPRGDPELAAAVQAIRAGRRR